MFNFNPNVMQVSDGGGSLTADEVLLGRAQAQLEKSKARLAELEKQQKAENVAKGLNPDGSKKTNTQLLQERQAKEEADRAALAASNPLFNKASKPTDAPAGMYYQWIGGTNTGQWQLYKIPASSTTQSSGFTPTPTPTPAPTSTTTTKAITQADVDAAVTKAVAAATAKTDALIAQQKADAAAAKFATKTKASDRLTAMFDGVGLGSLAKFINQRIMEDASEEAVLLELYDQPEYQARFPGMKALRSKGKTITEGEYIKDEKAFAQTARFFDVPVGFYDTPDDFGKLIGNLVSPKEFQDRLQVGQDLARSMSPGLRTQLQDLYNVGEGGITAYVLDSDRALPLIQKQAKAAQFVGFGREKGFKLEGMTAAQAEQIVGTEAYSKLSAQQMQTSLAQAARLRETQSRLTGIEGEVYNEGEALKAVIEGSPEALLASQQRAQRESARFGGGAGVTGSSLRTTPGI
jgi:hypothetical protein